MSPEKSEATVGQLLGALATDTGELVRQELHLAATELNEKATAAARNTGFIAAGGALLLIGCLALVAALILGLEPVLPLWASAGVVGLVFAGLGTACVMAGVSALRHLDPVPRTTLSTLDPTAVEQGGPLR